MKLRHIQTVALSEFHDNDGLFGSIAVGYGKSLISYLAATVVNAERPLLLIPAKLVAKTHRELENYGKHFKLPNNLKVMSYELLSRDRGEKELISYNPDLVVADECHKLKNLKAACTKRVGRYFKENPDTKMLAVSGTITRKSIMDYWHILKWCLKDKAPIPTGWREVKDWSLALDEQIPFGWQRLQPGCLLLLCTAEEQAIATTKPKAGLEFSRLGFRNRLTGSPGVVATSDTFTGSSLYLKCELNHTIEEIQSDFETLRSTWQTPDGVDFMDAMAFWRHCRELSNGFYYRWTNRPPAEWLAARKEWASFVRNIVSHSRKGIDTEFRVAKAVTSGDYVSPEYHTWKAIKDSFEPVTEAVWRSDNVILQVAKWLNNNEGIAWVEHLAFGEKLSQTTGLPFYSQNGMNRDKQLIEDAKGPIIASIASNSEGRNLQQYNNNLIVSCPPSGSVFEQLIGRTHRSGQTSDEVNFEIMFGCRESLEGFNEAIEQAKYVEATTKQPQKILFADIELCDETKIQQLKKTDWAWKKVK